ncbi:MAG: DNA polymerase III [Treponema sp.]|jgi:DNA polymerase-3 subunit gamma/tau|nr:DNA polymerase III [Treponema sp.]
MFENIIAQAAAERLREDLEAGILAPSMLFFGPPMSGKGTVALELGRVLSCEERGAWNCGCPQCARHRLLLHPDLLLMGPRPFAAEIAASSAVLLREPRHGRLLLLRALRKLLGRFSPVLWEGDRELGKLNPLIQALEEDVEELEGIGLEEPEKVKNAGEKLGASIVKNALKLEAEGIAEHIPVAQIRKASFWGRLAPVSRRKLLVIENADRMKEEALNSLLKILEEPPERLSIVLCTARREAILPTLLSRLRPYRFMARSRAAAEELIRRVYREPEFRGEAGLEAYLDSFLPVSRDSLYPLAAFFVSSVALAALDSFRRRGITALPEELVALGRHSAPIAGSAGLGRPVGDNKTIVDKVLAGAQDFQVRSLFPHFLAAALDLVSRSLAAGMGPRGLVYAGLWKNYAAEASAAVGIWNQNPSLALDRMISGLKGAMAEC